MNIKSIDSSGGPSILAPVLLASKKLLKLLVALWHANSFKNQNRSKDMMAERLWEEMGYEWCKPQTLREKGVSFELQKLLN